jgi:uncharacterized protein YgbK (DUF1537 family)
VIDTTTTDSFVVDARSSDDLVRIAATLERLGGRAIAVGSAGLAEAVAGSGSAAQYAPRTRPAAGRVLVAVSSLHPVAQSQLARLLQTIPVADGAGAQSPSEATVVVSTPRTLTPSEHSRDVAAALAGRVAAELQRQPYDALVLIGGDGALAVLDRLGAAQIEIVDNLAPGTPHGTVIGGTAHGLQVVTRSGGFGDVDALVHIVSRLRQPPLSPTDGVPSTIVDPAHQRN